MLPRPRIWPSAGAWACGMHSLFMARGETQKEAFDAYQAMRAERLVSVLLATSKARMPRRLVLFLATENT